MEIKDKIYFNNFTNYKPRVEKTISSENMQEIDYTSTRIRNTAKDALSEEISPTKARSEISDLMDTIKQLKRGIKFD